MSWTFHLTLLDALGFMDWTFSRMKEERRTGRTAFVQLSADAPSSEIVPSLDFETVKSQSMLNQIHL